jgi:hypothetical protein
MNISVADSPNLNHSRTTIYHLPNADIWRTIYPILCLGITIYHHPFNALESQILSSMHSMPLNHILITAL